MSFKATAWAWELDDERLKPAITLVLVAICDGAHEDKNFECVLKHSTLARRAKISEDSVSRHVAALKSWGYLHVVKNRGEDGKQLTNRYVVLLDDNARRHAYALGWDGAIEPASERSSERTENDDSEGSRPANCGSDRPANRTEPTRKFDGADPHCCGSVIDSFNESNDSPSKSPEALRERGASRDFEKRTGEAGAAVTRGAGADARIARWEAFHKAWPWDVGEMPEEARLQFMRLGDDEQAAAVEGGPRYIADRRSRDKFIAHAKTWLKGKGWQALKARSVESAAALGGGQFFAALGTAQFFRWIEYYAVVGGRPLKWRSKRDGAATFEGAPDGALMPMLFERGGRKGFWCDSEWPPPLATCGAAANGGAARAGPDGAAT